MPRKSTTLLTAQTVGILSMSRHWEFVLKKLHGSTQMAMVIALALVPHISMAQWQSEAASTVDPVVVEFYNATLDNYFVTSNASEAIAIDGGAAGPGWVRTGQTFNSGGSTAVCRFYGSLSPGPNSHFYTVDPLECQSLKDQQIPAADPRKLTVKGWNFESLDFLSTPSVAGKCSSRMASVYRAYNNGFTRGTDSNHRLTTSRTAITALVSKGWHDEGAVMCAPYVFDPVTFIGTSASSATSSINGLMTGSFGFTITNNSTETFLIRKAEISAGTVVRGSESRPSFISNGDLVPGESTGLTFTIQSGAAPTFRITYYLTDPVTGIDFSVHHDY